MWAGPESRDAALKAESRYEWWVRTLDVGEAGAWLLVDPEHVRTFGNW